MPDIVIPRRTSAFALQAGREPDVDVDQRAQDVGLRVAHQLDGLVHDEQAKVGHALADVGGKRIVVTGDRRNQQRPKLPVEQQSAAELFLTVVPVVVDGLKMRGRLKQEVGFQFAQA